MLQIFAKIDAVSSLLNNNFGAKAERDDGTLLFCVC